MLSSRSAHPEDQILSVWNVSTAIVSASLQYEANPTSDLLQTLTTTSTPDVSNIDVELGFYDDVPTIGSIIRACYAFPCYVNPNCSYNQTHLSYSGDPRGLSLIFGQGQICFQLVFAIISGFSAFILTYSALEIWHTCSNRRRRNRFFRRFRPATIDFHDNRIPALLNVVIMFLEGSWLSSALLYIFRITLTALGAHFLIMVGSAKQFLRMILNRVGVIVPPSVSPFGFFDPLTECFLICYFHVIPIFLFGLAYGSKDVCFLCFPLGLVIASRFITFRYGLDFRTHSIYIAPFTEEIFRALHPLTTPLIVVVEFMENTATLTSGIQMVPAVCLHLFLAELSFIPRVILHFSYNYAVHYGYFELLLPLSPYPCTASHIDEADAASRDRVLSSIKLILRWQLRFLTDFVSEDKLLHFGGLIANICINPTLRGITGALTQFSLPTLGGKLASAFSEYVDYLHSQVTFGFESASFSAWSKFSDFFDQGIDTLRGGLDSQLCVWAQRAITFVITFFAFDIMSLPFNVERFGLFNKKLALQSVSSPLEFALSGLEAIKKILDTGVSYISGGDKHIEAMSSSNPVSSFLVDSERVLRFKNFTHNAETTEHMMNENDFRLLLARTIKTGTELTALSRSLGPIATQVARRMTDLRSIDHTIHLREISGDKPPAMIVVLQALPGVGKATLIRLIHNVFERARGREYQPECVANIDPTLQFFDNVHNYTTIVHIEELGVTVHDGSSGEDKTVDTLLKYGDSNVQVVNKSAVEDKGKTVNRNELVSGTTNCIGMNVCKVHKFPAAIYRRLLSYDVQIKEEYRKSASYRADFAAVKDSGVSTLDVYEIREILIDTNRQDGRVQMDKNYVPVYELGPAMDVAEFIPHFQEKIARHFAADSIRKDAYNEAIAPLCEHNSVPSVCKKCLETDNDSSPGVYDQVFESGEKILGEKKPYKALGLKIFEYFLRLLTRLVWVFGFILTVLLWVCPVSIKCSLFDFALRNRCNHFCNMLESSIRHEAETIRLAALSFSQGFVLVKDYDRHVKAFQQLQERSKRLARPYLADFVTSLLFVLKTLLAIKLFCYGASFFTKEAAPEQSYEGNVVTTNVAPKSLQEVLEWQRNNNIHPSRAVPDRSDSRNHWDATPHQDLVSLPAAVLPLDQVCASVSRGCYNIEIVQGDESKFGNGLIIRPQVLMMNAHYVRGYPFELILKKVTATSEGKTRLCQSASFSISESDCMKVSSDVVLVYVPTMSGRDLVQYIPDHHPKGWFANSSFSGRLVRPKQVSVSSRLHTNLDQGIVHFDEAYQYVTPHAGGMCGTPLVLTIGTGASLVAIHSTGSNFDDTCFAAAFNRKQVESTISKLLESRALTTFSFEGRTKIYDINGSALVIGLPDDRSFLNWQAGYARYEGTIKNLSYTKTRAKMVFFPSAPLLEDFLGDFGFKNKDSEGDYLWQVPDFSERYNPDAPLGYQSPYHDWSAKAFQASDYCPTNLVERAVEDYWSRIEAAGILTKISPLDIRSVVSGDSSASRIRKMNLKASMGFGFKGVKGDFVTDLPSPQAPDGKMFEPNVLGDFVDSMNTYLSGETVSPVVKASLKVEARKKGKPPRVFCAVPTSDVLVARTFLTPLLNLMIEHPAVFETAVGTNAASPQWGTIRERFSECLKQVFDADISGFDTRMLPAIKLGAMTIIMRLADAAGYTEEEKKILRGYLTDYVFPLILVKNDLLILASLIPSGKVGTAETNSLCLSLIYRMVFYLIAERENDTDADFNRDIVLLTYGDDSKAGSHKSWFTQERFCSEAKSFGIIATTADKSDDFAQFVHFDGAEFLHRTWRWDEEYAVWCAPLNVSSMARSLTLNVRSPIGIYAQMAETSTSINFELAQHGREFFDKVMPQLIELLIASGVDEHVGLPTFKTFEEIMDSCYR